MYRVRAVTDGWPGGPGLSTFYFTDSPDGPGVQANAQLCVDRVQGAFDAEISNAFPPEWTAQVQPQVDEIDPANGALIASFAVPQPLPIPGTGSAGFGPAMSGMSLSLLTAGIVGKHRVRGRVFLVPLNNGGGDTDGTPGDAVINAVRAFGELLIQAGANPHYVVWSRPLTAGPGLPPALNGSTHVVTGIQVSNRYSVLTSRRA